MTAIEKVRRTRHIIAAVALARALAWGFALTLLLVALLAFGSLLSPELSFRLAGYQWLALGVGIAFSIVLLWRSRSVLSPKNVALWIEERVPSLQYSLVTALEYPASPFAPGMEARTADTDTRQATLRAARRPLGIAAAAVLIGMALLYVSPSGAFGSHRLNSAFAGRVRSYDVKGGVGSRLTDIEVRVTPPGYTGQRASTLRDPSTVSALTGSSVTVRGIGSTSGLSATLDTPLRISGAGSQWAFSFPMPQKPAALRLKDGDLERVIVLAPSPDDPPKIVLSSPVHDTALRTPRLVVQLNATTTDDIGLGEGHFEYLITTGSGEIFIARTINTPTVRFNGARSGGLTASLDLASLKLGEGDVVSMRAIAQDRNSISGPGISMSDTRTIRIVRASEYDSLSIEAAAPPPLDSSAMSQRMLIVMTEQLVREQPKLARPDLVNRSTNIGDLEDRIRRRVREILNDGEEAPPQEQLPDSAAPTVEEMESSDEINGSKNPDLFAAYNLLWDAVRSLKIAEPAKALPPMREALKALDRARLANRLYLRGTPPKIIVDLNRVRLTGKEKGNSNVRSPRSFADSARVRFSARFETALDQLARNPSSAMSNLALLRVDALSTLPDFAAALGEAFDAIRAGRDATLPLLRARRALEGRPEVAPLTQWGGG
jgi:hypothetical protein